MDFSCRSPSHWNLFSDARGRSGAFVQGLLNLKCVGNLDTRVEWHSAHLARNEQGSWIPLGGLLDGFLEASWGRALGASWGPLGSFGAFRGSSGASSGCLHPYSEVVQGISEHRVVGGLGIRLCSHSCGVVSSLWIRSVPCLTPLAAPSLHCASAT